VADLRKRVDIYLEMKITQTYGYREKQIEKRNRQRNKKKN